VLVGKTLCRIWRVISVDGWILNLTIVEEVVNAVGILIMWHGMSSSRKEKIEILTASRRGVLSHPREQPE
jgi:hypothetical protein